jgi:threonine synthase
LRLTFRAIAPFLESKLSYSKRRKYLVANKTLSFKDRDIRRLMRAARAEGLTPTAVEVDTKTGKIKVVSGKPADTGNEVEKWLEEHREGAA